MLGDREHEWPHRGLLRCQFGILEAIKCYRPSRTSSKVLTSCSRFAQVLKYHFGTRLGMLRLFAMKDGDSFLMLFTQRYLGITRCMKPCLSVPVDHYRITVAARSWCAQASPPSVAQGRQRPEKSCHQTEWVLCHYSCHWK